jgi:hypothetical protein
MRSREVMANGVVETVMDGDNSGDLIIKRESDAEALVERNKALRNDGFTGEGKDKTGLRWIGSVDPNVIAMWNQIDGVDIMRMPADEFEKYMMKKLLDPDWKNLRVTDRI